MSWHDLEIDEVERLLGVERHGLDRAEAQHRLAHHGPNELERGTRRTTAGLLVAQLEDWMIVVLFVAAAIAGAIGDRTDAIVILAIVLVNTVIGALQAYRAERSLEALRQISAPQATVRRGGAVCVVPARELVPGDVVLLEAGQVVPADLRLSHCHDLRLQEAALTGESLDVAKQTEALPARDLPLGDRTNLGFKGTLVAKGRGEGFVVATGMQTEMGRIARLLEQKTPATPLQRRMAAFGKRISVAVLALCGLLFLAGWLRGGDPIPLLLTAISLAVAAIPEALPALMSVSLALSAGRMARQHALVRRLAAVETLGSVTVICTDKTGTLTRNRMRVERLVPVDAASLSPLLEAMALDNDVVRDPDGEPVGEGTEVALYEHARSHGIDKAEAERALPRVAEIPFDAARKRMSTIHQRADGRRVLFIKGAPEALMPRATRPPPAWGIEAERLAAEGLRVIAFGWRTLPVGELPEDRAGLERDITLLGLVGIQDPPRDEVPQAIADCQGAGIRTLMITGDHPATARTIARQVGILTEAESADPRSLITGPELARLSAGALLDRVDPIRVYARVSPEQKLDIVAALQARGHFVAMTGDGVNDAPALKRADIGVAMGMTGTDVAREAADMVLLDDDFATLARAVKEGRRVFDNIRKFIQYILTANAGEIWAIALAPMIGLPIPLLPVHILWINLVTDGLPGLFLSLEPAERDLMQRPPRDPDESVFAHGLGAHVLWVGLLMGGVTLAAQAWAIGNADTRWQTIAFNVLCLSQMGHVLAIRSERSFLRSRPFSNPALLAAVALTFALQALVTFAPPLQDLLHTEALAPREILVVGALSSVVFLGVEAEKLARRRIRSS
ncbi:MAG: cation-translocating P-type ATPase [Holophagales bacterium]|nr:cation-translocating P-type ATPase [Holophagales bacterium]